MFTLGVYSGCRHWVSTLGEGASLWVYSVVASLGGWSGWLLCGGYTWVWLPGYSLSGCPWMSGWVVAGGCLVEWLHVVAWSSGCPQRGMQEHREGPEEYCRCSYFVLSLPSDPCMLVASCTSWRRFLQLHRAHGDVRGVCVGAGAVAGQALRRLQPDNWQVLRPLPRQGQDAQRSVGRRAAHPALLQMRRQPRGVPLLPRRRLVFPRASPLN